MSDWKYIPDDVCKAYDKASWKLFSLQAGKPDSPLYHYTTGQALIEILDSGTLWSTQMACINDTTELTYAVELLEKRIASRHALPNEERLSPLWAAIRREIAITRTEIAGAFAACFSTKDDDLSQWRAYSGGEGGYAIEFDSQKLQAGAWEDGRSFLIKVAYDVGRQVAILDEAIEMTIEFYEKGLATSKAPSVGAWLEEFIPCWLQRLSYLAPCFKHPSFEQEDEWRVLHFFTPEDVPRLQFRQRNSMMTRHLPLQLGTLDGKPRLPVTGVTIGPCRHISVSQVSVGDLLLRSGYVPDRDVNLRPTKTPFQAL